MALSDEEFVLEEDEEDYTTESDQKDNNDGDESEESEQSESDGETTQSESNSESESQSDANSDSDENEEELQMQIKQQQMEKAIKDLENIHKKLREIIEEKLQSRQTRKRDRRRRKKYRDKSREADEEYLADMASDMKDCDGLIDVLTQQPSIINMEKGILRNYQLDGLNWLIRVQETGLNAILADEMGLGKTLQCISLLAYNKEYKQRSGPHLIVVPKSTIFNWRKEFAEWCPTFRIFLLDGDKMKRKELIDEYINSVLDESNLEFDICITSYEQANIEAVYLQKINWFYIVIDEAHRMKNEHAKLSRTCRSFNSKQRLLITGTPLQNNLHELWALLNFLIPDAFQNSQSFDVLFEAKNMQKNETNNGNNEVIAMINKMLGKMHNLLRPLMLRRLKYDVEKTLPPKTEMILYVGMSTLQIALYKSLLSKNISVLRDTITSKKALLNTAMQLRKVCNHPYLFDGVEDRSLNPHGQHLIDNAAKLCMLNKLLPKLKEQHSKCLIFCQMTRMLDILDDYCFIKGYKRCRIDGNTHGIDRQSQMDDFNSRHSDKFIFLLSTRAGGLGINLVAADCVIFYDSDWNPQMDLQAQDRAHRIGQQKPVKIFRLITKNTIEERILQRAQCKLNLDELVIQQAAKINKNEVSSMINYGVTEILKLKDGDNSLREMNEMSIDEILSKGKEASKTLNELMAKHAKNKFSIKSTDYSLLEDCKLDKDVFRTLAKIKQQNDPFGNHSNDNRKVGGRRTNNSSNGYNQFDLEKKIKEINRGSNSKHKKNDLEPPEKPPSLQYFQFFDKELLVPLFEKERAWFKKYKNMEQDEIPEENSSRYGLTEYEYKLKQRLLSEGFGEWNHRDMWGFMKSCTDNGRENIDKICEALPTKTRQEIMRYSYAFFSNKYKDKEIDKKIKQIINGEDIIQRYSKYDDLLRQKIAKYKYPWQEMEFPTCPYDSRAHGWRVEHDRFIVMKLSEFGYGNWSEVRLAMHNDPRFAFDYFVRSRTALDINKRMRQIRPAIEREFDAHIPIFDRKLTKQQIEERKQYDENRLNNHLQNMSKVFNQRQEQQQHQNEDEDDDDEKEQEESMSNASNMSDNENDDEPEDEAEEEEQQQQQQQVPPPQQPPPPQQVHYSFMPPPPGVFPFAPPPENMVYYSHPPPNAQFHTTQSHVYQMSYQTQSMVTPHPTRERSSRHRNRTNTT